MPITYARCDQKDDAVLDLLCELIDAHYPDLRDLYCRPDDDERRYCDAQVVRERIVCLFAASDAGHAVKLHGYPCIAVIKVNNLKDRVQGKGDVTIEIDEETWEKELTVPQQRSVLDHELHHLVVKRKNGEVVTDDIDRPKFDLRLHDLVVGGFAQIVARYGDDAIDYAHLQSAHNKLHEVTGKNYAFEFDDDGRLMRESRPLFHHQQDQR